ncbi:MAG: hypothetical protein IJ797_03900, partial [Selenomonadaceae bacterium]|nr:hypothetical protein [Selenomonadaceae bacterium]
GSVNAGDDFVYSNFFTQDLYDRCDGKGPFDQKPNLENAPTNNFQTAFREFALGSFQDNYVTNLGDSSSIISQKAKNKPETLQNGAQVYNLPYCVAYVKDDKVQMMVCATIQGESASGIRLGKNFNLEKILAAYGKGYVKSYHRGRDLYEYKTLSQDGKTAIIRIAVNPVSKGVDYMVMYYLDGELKPSQGVVLDSRKELSK